MHRLETFEPKPALAYALLVFATITWAASAVIGRGVHETIPPLGLSFWRWLVGVFILLPFVWGDIIRKWAMIRENFGLLLALGVLQVGSSALMLNSVTFTTAINATLINAAMPITTAIAALIVLKDKLTVGQMAGVTLAICGVLYMVGRGDLGVIFTLDFNRGDLLAFVAIIGWAYYATLLRRIPRELGLTTSLAVMLGLGCLGLLPFYIAESLLYMPVPIGATTIQAVIFLGIFASLIAIFIWNSGVRAIGPNRATIFVNLTPVFGAGMAIWLLGETLFAFHVIGAVLVAIGIFLVINHARAN